jgi:hypothetical protein
MNPWFALTVLLGVSIFVYLFLIMKNRMEIPKAGLAAITVYIILGLTLIALGWNVSPWIVVLPGLFVALLDVLQIRQPS